MTSDATARANALVADRRPAAVALGHELADIVDDPEAFVLALTRGLDELADPAYEAEQERIAPGSGPTIGVRAPLWAEVQRPLRRSLRQSSSASALSLAQRLATSDFRDVRLFALPCLRRSLADDPERSWQLMRRLAGGAAEWISVDSLADLWAYGLLLEAHRWAELEQLVYSPRQGERRLVGSSLARIPYQLPPGDRASRLDPTQPLALIASLMGDDADLVQKALSWALREWSRLDHLAVERLLEAQARIAVETDDGHRAWVIRDSLQFVDPAVAAALRARLAGIRRRPRAGPTSTASQVAAAFAAPAALTQRALAQQGERFAGSRA